MKKVSVSRSRPSAHRLSAFVAGILLVLFVAVAVGVMTGWTDAFDAGVRATVHQSASPGITTLAQVASYFGSLKVIIPLTIVILFGFLAVGDRRSAVALGATIGVALMLNWGLKNAFHRVRPQPFFGIDPETFSFPSGHALFASCFYGALGLILQGKHKTPLLLSPLIAMVCVIGWSRIYLGVHYPTDVIGGYLTGLFLLAILRRTGLFPPD